ncbi:Uncharacterised protein [Streptococcus pyogenes]|nr:Uncharacterised protein [Streptococcus pyogenes]
MIQSISSGFVSRDSSRRRSSCVAIGVTVLVVRVVAGERRGTHDRALVTDRLHLVVDLVVVPVGVRTAHLLLERDRRSGIEEREGAGELLRVFLRHVGEDHGRLIEPAATLAREHEPVDLQRHRRGTADSDTLLQDLLFPGALGRLVLRVDLRRGLLTLAGVVTPRGLGEPGLAEDLPVDAERCALVLLDADIELDLVECDLARVTRHVEAREHLATGVEGRALPEPVEVEGRLGHEDLPGTETQVTHPRGERLVEAVEQAVQLREVRAARVREDALLPPCRRRHVLVVDGCQTVDAGQDARVGVHEFGICRRLRDRLQGDALAEVVGAALEQGVLDVPDRVVLQVTVVDRPLHVLGPERALDHAPRAERRNDDVRSGRLQPGVLGDGGVPADDERDGTESGLELAHLVERRVRFVTVRDQVQAVLSLLRRTERLLELHLGRFREHEVRRECREVRGGGDVQACTRLTGRDRAAPEHAGRGSDETTLHRLPVTDVRGTGGLGVAVHLRERCGVARVPGVVLGERPVCEVPRCGHPGGVLGGDRHGSPSGCIRRRRGAASSSRSSG